ncbi:hypothetical protein HK102_003795, partial [Quaeritorhiza haematococci]
MSAHPTPRYSDYDHDPATDEQDYWLPGYEGPDPPPSEYYYPYTPDPPRTATPVRDHPGYVSSRHRPAFYASMAHQPQYYRSNMESAAAPNTPLMPPTPKGKSSQTSLDTPKGRIPPSIDTPPVKPNTGNLQTPLDTTKKPLSTGGSKTSTLGDGPVDITAAKGKSTPREEDDVSIYLKFE